MTLALSSALSVKFCISAAMAARSMPSLPAALLVALSDKFCKSVAASARWVLSLVAWPLWSLTPSPPFGMVDVGHPPEVGCLAV